MQQREKEKLRQSLRHQNLDLATLSVVFYVLTNITSHIIFFVVLLLATPSRLAHSLGCSHIVYTSRSPASISSFCSTSPATHCYSILLESGSNPDIPEYSTTVYMLINTPADA